MTWSDFDADSALERDLLMRALPLVPTKSDGSTSVVVNLDGGPQTVALAQSATIGPTPENCVELLGIRPLFVGAAWKTFDLLQETAYAQVGMTPRSGSRWSIAEKVGHARAGVARPAAIPVDEWSALTTTYAEIEDLRHSLVHRKVYTDAQHALVGVDNNGNPVRPFTAEEQEAFARATLRAAELVTAHVPDPRVAADLTRQLGSLHAIHGVALPAVSMLDALPELIVELHPDPDAPSTYVLDVSRLRGRQPFAGLVHADVTVRFLDRPGFVAKGRLENAPDWVDRIDPDDLPAWLQ